MIVPAKYVMLFRRIVFWPFAVAYASVLHIRHALYDIGVFKRTRPTVPTIAIGNLALGGTGKTPMLELVLRILKDIKVVATLSRGYGRSGTDILEVGAEDTATESGDEPLQVKRKFPAVRVFIGTDRVKAISVIQRQVPEVKVIALDDALQHRRLDAGLNILLTTWTKPYCDDALIPAGTLRDLRSRAGAAHVVVVTKCPNLPTAEEADSWFTRLALRSEQQLFFSGIEYQVPEWLEDRQEPIATGQEVKALLFTGVADPLPLVMHAKSQFGTVEHAAFPDHHRFNASDLRGLAERYTKFAPGPKLLVTTEKDAARLGSVIAGSPLEGLPIAMIGMRAIILNEPERFERLIQDHVASHTAHR